MRDGFFRFDHFLIGRIVSAESLLREFGKRRARTRNRVGVDAEGDAEDDDGNDEGSEGNGFGRKALIRIFGHLTGLVLFYGFGLLGFFAFRRVAAIEWFDGLQMLLRISADLYGFVFVVVGHGAERLSLDTHKFVAERGIRLGDVPFFDGVLRVEVVAFDYRARSVDDVELGGILDAESVADDAGADVGSEELDRIEDKIGHAVATPGGLERVEVVGELFGEIAGKEDAERVFVGLVPCRIHGQKEVFGLPVVEIGHVFGFVRSGGGHGRYRLGTGIERGRTVVTAEKEGKEPK